MQDNQSAWPGIALALGVVGATTVLTALNVLSAGMATPIFGGALIIAERLIPTRRARNSSPPSSSSSSAATTITHGPTALVIAGMGAAGLASHLFM